MAVEKRWSLDKEGLIHDNLFIEYLTDSLKGPDRSPGNVWRSKKFPEMVNFDIFKKFDKCALATELLSSKDEQVATNYKMQRNSLIVSPKCPQAIQNAGF